MAFCKLGTKGSETEKFIKKEQEKLEHQKNRRESNEKQKGKVKSLVCVCSDFSVTLEITSVEFRD